VIAGEGPALASLKKLAAKLNLQEHALFRRLPRQARRPARLLLRADAFVFASRTETQGLVLLEAMALGLPVISTAVMGTRDIVGPKRGALVPDDDEADFAETYRQIDAATATCARGWPKKAALTCASGTPMRGATTVATYQDVVATYLRPRGLLSGMRGQRLPSPIAMPLHYMRKL